MRNQFRFIKDILVCDWYGISRKQEKKCASKNCEKKTPKLYSGIARLYAQEMLETAIRSIFALLAEEGQHFTLEFWS